MFSPRPPRRKIEGLEHTCGSRALRWPRCKRSNPQQLVGWWIQGIKYLVFTYCKWKLCNIYIHIHMQIYMLLVLIRAVRIIGFHDGNPLGNGMMGNLAGCSPFSHPQEKQEALVWETFIGGGRLEGCCLTVHEKKWVGKDYIIICCWPPPTAQGKYKLTISHDVSATKSIFYPSSSLPPITLQCKMTPLVFIKTMVLKLEIRTILSINSAHVFSDTYKICINIGPSYI